MANFSGQELTAAETEELDRDVRAFIEIFPDAFISPPRSGPLAGLHFAVKEVIDQKGKNTPWGTPLLNGRIPATSASVVSRLEAAGAISIGTTKSTEFALAGETDVANPWAQGHTPGASSAGSAAAVAAGIVKLALGTQTIGSIIRPAAYCGVVGFKPTHSVIPNDGMLSLSTHLDDVGFLSRSVEIAKSAFSVFQENQSSARMTKMAVAKTWFSDGVDMQITSAISAVAARCARFGFRVSNMEIPKSIGATEERLLDILLVKELHERHGDFVRHHRAELLPDLVTMIERGASVTDEQFSYALSSRDVIQDLLHKAVDDETVVIAPATVEVAPLIGEGTGSRAPQRLWTLVGWPAITIPVAMGRSETGNRLPIGIQLISRPGTDHALLDTAINLSQILQRSSNNSEFLYA